MPKVGKNVLENLTQGMYTNPQIIYREYIQNAADQIDKARASNAFPDENLEIAIKVDALKRRITIEDNANGIPKAEVERRLADVADSEKIQGEDKGFRGIGRLGGLAYCRELRFVTTYAGESEQTTMIWDAAMLKDFLSAPDVRSNAEEILERIIRYEYEPCEASAHYFRVELIDVDEGGDQLLNVEKVSAYVSEVAPLEYSERFSTLAHNIYSFIDDQNATAPPVKKIALHRYDIWIGGEQIYRPYSTYIRQVNKNSRDDEIKGIQTDLIKTADGKIVAWIWYGISCFKTAIQPEGYKGLVGLRLRQFNMEIGDDRTLDQFFHEKNRRGNNYFVGEVHTLSPNLIPNGRRDYFVRNEALTEFEEALDDYVRRNLDKLYRDGSDLNSNFNKIAKRDELEEKYEQKKLKGFSSPKEEETLRAELEAARKSAEEAVKKIDKIIERANKSPGSPLKKMVDLVQKERGYGQTQSIRQPEPDPQSEPKKKSKPKLMVDELSHLKKSERKLVSLIYEVIRENMSPELSEALIHNIHTEIKAQK